jgi:hypothetical protein
MTDKLVLKQDNVYNNTRSKIAGDENKLFKPLVISTTIDEKDFVSATKSFNFIADDEFSDLVNMKNKEENKENKENKEDTKINSKNFFSNMGNEFERNIIDYLKSKYMNDVKQICEQNQLYNFNDIKNISEQTKKLLEEKTPIIISAPVIDLENKTYGICDMIIRLDFFYKLFEIDTRLFLDKEEEDIDCQYVIVDIKWKKLDIIKKYMLSNSSKFKHYKSQVYIYTIALKNMFKSNKYLKFSKYASILGKGCSFTDSGNKIVKNNPFFCPGLVDTTDKNIIEQTNKAIHWFRQIQKLNKLIDYEQSIYNFSPNLSVSSYNPIYKYKLEISEHSKEISLIYGCGQISKKIAHEKGFDSWSDDNLNSEIIGIKGQKGERFDKIVWINNQTNFKYHPLVIKNNFKSWKDMKNPCFIDFEFFPKNIFDDFTNITNIKSMNGIFLIGIGYIEEENWKYEKFLCKKMDQENEKECLENMISFYINKMFDCAYFYDIEENMFNKKIKDYQIDIKHDINWINIKTILTSEPVVFKDCFNYRLKSIIKSMNKHNLVNLKNESDTQNGFDCMIEMYMYYKNKSDENNYDKLLQDTLIYNNFDCKCMFEIINFLNKL